jgi:hypothetical protein
LSFQCIKREKQLMRAATGTILISTLLEGIAISLEVDVVGVGCVGDAGVVYISVGVGVGVCVLGAG